MPKSRKRPLLHRGKSSTRGKARNKFKLAKGKTAKHKRATAKKTVPRKARVAKPSSALADCA
jgi:hypothetical protein